MTLEQLKKVEAILIAKGFSMSDAKTEDDLDVMAIVFDRGLLQMLPHSLTAVQDAIKAKELKT